MAGSDILLATNNTYSQLPKRLESLKLSASSFSGNLAVLSDTRGECCGYAVAHGSSVCVIRWEPGSSCRQTFIEPFASATEEGVVDSLTLITGVKWCDLLSGQTVLVITSFAGFVVMNTDGTIRIFQYRMTHKEHSTGITAVGNSLCIGTSEGSVLVFSIKEEGVEFQQQLDGHQAPVTCMASSIDGRVASGDETGRVLVWRDPVRSSEKLKLFDDKSLYPCVHISWWKDMIITSSGNGILRIYNGKSRGLLIEVSAHSRWITDMDVSLETGLILSVSEDSSVCVWKLSSGKTPKLSLLHNRIIKNSLLCGAKFCDRVGSMFAVSSYDSNVVVEFGRS